MMDSREQQFLEERSWYDWYSAFVQWLRFRDAIEAGEAKSVSDLARKARMERVFLYHSLELANLAPDIIRAIVDGDVPDGFTLKRLRHGIPDDWDEQRREFGFL